MRKIHEIDCVEVGIHPYGQVGSRRRHRPSYKFKAEFIEAALSNGQLMFLEDKHWRMRPHPRHNPTIELFIEEEELTARDWTVIGLLFQRNKA